MHRARHLLKSAWDGYFDDRCPQLSAGIAYYTLFALFPLTILSVAAFGLVVGAGTARTELIDFLLDNVPLQPDSGRRELERILENVTSDAEAFGVVGIAGLVFSASGLMGSLRYALSRAFDVDEQRPLLLGKLVDVLLVLAVGIVAGASLALTLVERLTASASSALADALSPAVAFVPQTVLALGQLVPLLLATLIFAFLYRFVPARDIRWRDALPGALIAAVAYEAVKTGFAFYLHNVASYGAVYGSIATVIALAFFVFLSANVFLAGAEIAAAWPRVLGADARLTGWVVSGPTDRAGAGPREGSASSIPLKEAIHVRRSTNCAATDVTRSPPPQCATQSCSARTSASTPSTESPWRDSSVRSGSRTTAASALRRGVRCGGHPTCCSTSTPPSRNRSSDSRRRMTSSPTA